MLFDNDFEFMNLNFEQSINFYRMDEDENIELIVGDADEMFPNGGISGLGSGFGNHENQYIWNMTVYDGKLYVGTFDASSFLIPLDEYMNDENASKEWKDKVDEYVEKFAKIIMVFLTVPINVLNILIRQPLALIYMSQRTE